VVATATSSILQRSIYELALHSAQSYASPFADVTLDAIFTGPSGQTITIPGFYDGNQSWRVRFNPNEPGRWRYRTVSRPANADLDTSGEFEVTPQESRGFVRATPGQAWGFAYESGEPAFFLGDTVYNLFGMAHCGYPVDSFLQRRAEQGFNLLRIRVPCSPFHPPRGDSDWQTRRTWAWGGSEQAPRFDLFNLDYFRTVDQVIQRCEALGLGIELIMEAWGFEFPFNSRQIFTPEWEELWLRYLIARYDAYNCIYFWTPLNEYEYYPNGDWHYKPVADRWAMRIARWIKGVAQHGHILAMHNGPREPAFARRFAADPEAVDAIMFQEWGTRDREQGWLAAGIEEQIGRSLDGWWGSAIFAEYGYERNPAFALNLPGHEFCDEEHTRRGAWRGAFCGLSVIHGFENSWGPWCLLEEDQPGLVYLLHFRRFFSEIVPFHRLRPAPERILSGPHELGHQPLALASAKADLMVVYLPTGGSVDLALDHRQNYTARWYNPRTGELTPAGTITNAAPSRFFAPGGESQPGKPWDWVLVIDQ
jgi:hypothetical protein